MKTLRTFLLISAAIAVPIQFFRVTAAPKSTPPIRLEGCGIEFSVQGTYRIEKQGTEWILIRKNYGSSQNIRAARLILTCNSNKKKTSGISEIRTEAGKRKQIIRYYRELQTDQAIQAATYLKIRFHGGRKVISADAYWATRAHEYRISLIPEKRKSELKLEDHLPLTKDLLRMLKNMRFTGPVRPAITEASYRVRLHVALGLLGALALALAALLLKRVLKKNAAVG